MALTSSVILVGIIIYIVFKRIFSFDYWHSKGIPYLEPSFPFGNLKGAGKKFHASQVIWNAYNEFKDTGVKYCGAYLWNRPIAILLDLDLIQNVMVKDFSNFSDRGAYYNEKDDPLSASTFSVDGARWRESRRKFTPAFTSGKMKHMFPTVLGIGEQLRNTLTESILKKENIFQIDELMTQFVCDVIGSCMFGIECNCFQDANGDFNRISRSVKHRHGPLIHAFIASFQSIARKLRVKVWPDKLTEFFSNVTKYTIEYREKNDVSRNDFMDILLNLKNTPNRENDKITTTGIAAELFGLFLAGFKTSSTTLTYCLFHLARNIDIQTKARKKIQKAYEKHGGHFTYEMLLDMPYIDQVLQGKMFQ